jgi:hypothetical protein
MADRGARFYHFFDGKESLVRVVLETSRSVDLRWGYEWLVGCRNREEWDESTGEEQALIARIPAPRGGSSRRAPG